MSARTEMPISQKAVLNTTEAATYINISNDEVRRLCKKGVIPAFRSGPNFKVPKRSLDMIVEEWAEKGISLADL